MTIKTRVASFVENLTNTRIFRYLPRGVDLFHDITRNLPAVNISVVFDVGANKGQSAIEFLRWFPSARIYCFEPVGKTFYQLQKTLKGNERVESFKLALGGAKGKGKVLLEGPSDMYRLENNADDNVSNDSAKSFEDVDLDTLDMVCQNRNIDRIGYLKIDTEGGDLDVLKGSERMLSEQKIDLVGVEAGMNIKNERHIPFEILKKFLEPKKYFLFGIYEQVPEWPTKEPLLRRVNPVFISERVIEENNYC